MQVVRGLDEVVEAPWDTAQVDIDRRPKTDLKRNGRSDSHLGTSLFATSCVSEILSVNKVRLRIFPECVARVPVSLGGLGVRLCSPSFAFAVATVRNRSQPFASVRNRLR